MITGATGFIGRNLATYLSDRDPSFEITCTYYRRQPWSDEFQWMKCDLRRAEEVESLFQLGFDIVYHCAATTSGSGDIVTQPHIHVTDNATMSSILFRACYDHRVRHVVFLSCTVMLPSQDAHQTEEDFSESGPIEPKYFGAAWTKIYLEKVCEFFANHNGPQFTVLRHSNIFGPFDKFDLKHSHVFGATVTKILTSTDGTVEIWGDGSEKRDFLYVTDLCEAMYLCVRRQHSSYEIFNIGYGTSRTIKKLAEMIATASGRDITMLYNKTMPTIPVSISLNCTKAKNQLGWEPRIEIESGIKKTIDWWNENIKDV